MCSHRLPTASGATGGKTKNVFCRWPPSTHLSQLPRQPVGLAGGDGDDPRLVHAVRDLVPPRGVGEVLTRGAERGQRAAGPADGDDRAVRVELPRHRLLERIGATQGEQLEQRSPRRGDRRQREAVVVERSQVERRAVEGRRRELAVSPPGRRRGRDGTDQAPRTAARNPPTRNR